MPDAEGNPADEAEARAILHSGAGTELRNARQRLEAVGRRFDLVAGICQELG